MPVTPTRPSKYQPKVAVYNAAGAPVYAAQAHQDRAHACAAPNLLLLGTRNTGKSVWLRWDAIIRCMMIPNFRALIIRRQLGDLRKTHLMDIAVEMKQLGGREAGFVYIENPAYQARFPNGSTITFAHCENPKDILDYLGAEYGFIGFDELSTFSVEMFLQIGASARSVVGAPYRAVVRATSNPLGPGADWMRDWFVDKTVDYTQYPDYRPEDFEMHFSTMDDNEYADKVDYEKRLRNLPAHVRKAWLKGEFVIVGAYFEDFEKVREQTLDGKPATTPWHVIQALPTWEHQGRRLPILSLDWIRVYRAIDWGWYPDPCVCLWIAVLPNGRAIVFKERKWTRTTAADVAKDIKRESAGFRVVDTFCDPTMFIKHGEARFSNGEQFELNGIPLSPSVNDRALYGAAIHDYLNTILPDGLPKLQILAPAVTQYSGGRDLIRTLPMMRMDPRDTTKIADGDDHWVVALAYFCIGDAPASVDPTRSELPIWMRSRKHVLR